MADHPIHSLMETAMSSIKEMVDVNTIIGDPITTPDNTVIIPVSKVSFGFGSGGSDYPNQTGNGAFGGGSGGGVTIHPIAFIIVNGGNVKLLQINENASSIDRIIEMVPDITDKIIAYFKKDKKTEEDVNIEF